MDTVLPSLTYAVAACVPELAQEAIDLIAARFKALSDPWRLKLILALESGEKNVTALVEAAKKLQTNVSRQLPLLAEAADFSRRRLGHCAGDGRCPS